MTVDAKICGINAPAALQAAIGGGARFIGLVFYPPSPRALEPDQAAVLARMVPDGIAKVGLLVDIDDARLDEIVSRVPLDILQLHGGESPDAGRGNQGGDGIARDEGDQGRGRR